MLQLGFVWQIKYFLPRRLIIHATNGKARRRGRTFTVYLTISKLSFLKVVIQGYQAASAKQPTSESVSVDRSQGEQNLSSCLMHLSSCEVRQIKVSTDCQARAKIKAGHKLERDPAGDTSRSTRPRKVKQKQKQGDGNHVFQRP